MNDIIRRKLSRDTDERGEGGSGADHGWRLALARAARDRIGLTVEVSRLQSGRCSLAELLEHLPEHGLFALLDGPGEGHGLIAWAPETYMALIEWQTLGRILPSPAATRRPTRTDAAMLADLTDHALSGLSELLADEADLAWAGDFCYASFIEEVRVLGLVLEDQAYRLLTARLSLGGQGREGQVLLVLPANGRGIRPPTRPGAHVAGPQPQAFAAALAQAVMSADCRLDAVICRLQLPLCKVMALAPGGELPLDGAALARISLLGQDGQEVALARLGQHRGMRALRINGHGAEEAMIAGDGEGAFPNLPPSTETVLLGDGIDVRMEVTEINNIM